MPSKFYLPAGALLGLTVGMLVSRSHGILILLTLGTALGWLISLVDRDLD